MNMWVSVWKLFMLLFFMFQARHSSEACRVSLRSAGAALLSNIYIVSLSTLQNSHVHMFTLKMQRHNPETCYATEFKLLDKKGKRPIS